MIEKLGKEGELLEGKRGERIKVRERVRGGKKSVEKKKTK